MVPMWCATTAAVVVGETLVIPIDGVDRDI